MLNSNTRRGATHNHGEEPFARAKLRPRKRPPTVRLPPWSSRLSCDLERQGQALLTNPLLPPVLDERRRGLLLQQGRKEQDRIRRRPCKRQGIVCGPPQQDALFRLPGLFQQLQQQPILQFFQLARCSDPEGDRRHLEPRVGPEPCPDPLLSVIHVFSLRFCFCLVFPRAPARGINEKPAIDWQSRVFQKSVLVG